MGPLIAICAGLAILALGAFLARWTDDREEHDGAMGGSQAALNETYDDGDWIGFD